MKDDHDRIIPVTLSALAVSRWTGQEGSEIHKIVFAQIPAKPVPCLCQP